MTDESSPFDFFPRPRTWPTWMLTASRNSGVAPPELRQIPARISVNWVESPNGGAIGVPDPLWDYGNPGHWTEPFLSKPTESASGGILGNMGAELEGPPWFDPGPDMKSIMPWPVWMRALAPESLFTGQRAPSPKPPIPTGLPMSRAGDPYTAPVSESEPLRTPPRDNLVAGRAAVPSQPSGLNVAVPQVHDLGSARYPGTAPSPAGTEPIPGNDDLLSPTILARSWESARAIDGTGQVFSELPSATDWAAPAPPIPAQLHSGKEVAAKQTAPTGHPVAQAQFGQPQSDPHQDFAQATPFGGFDSPSPIESLANQSEFYECMRSRTGTAAPMKGGNYEFCTYGRLAIAKQDQIRASPQSCRSRQGQTATRSMAVIALPVRGAAGPLRQANVSSRRSTRMAISE